MVDFGPTASDYAQHRAGFPAELYHRLESRDIARPGLRALDLGTGTGNLALGLAKRGLHVTGLDLSAKLLAEAARAAAAGHVQLELVEARAEATGLTSGGFDLVTAGQCWHWFDRAAAARETWRLLGSGGTVVIAHLDWLAFGDNLVARTLATVEACGGRWPPDVLALAHEGLYPTWTRDLREAGFTGVETFSFDLDLHYTKESWRGRMRASAAVGGSLEPHRVEAFDRALERELGGDPDRLAVPHRVFAAWARKPS